MGGGIAVCQVFWFVGRSALGREHRACAVTDCVNELRAAPRPAKFLCRSGRYPPCHCRYQHKPGKKPRRAYRRPARYSVFIQSNLRSRHHACDSVKWHRCPPNVELRSLPTRFWLVGSIVVRNRQARQTRLPRIRSRRSGPVQQDESISKCNTPDWARRQNNFENHYGWCLKAPEAPFLPSIVRGPIG